MEGRLMDLFVRMQKFINKEIKEENEPKDTAVLVRVLCLLDVFFITLSGICNGIQYGITYGVISVVLTILMWITFILSYHVKMKMLVYVYYICLIFNIVILVLMFGLSYMFQSQLYVSFMIFFYRAAGKKSERWFSVISSCIILICLFFYVGVAGNTVAVQPFRNTTTTVICTLYIVSKSAMIALFFRKKFSASEEKIIRYSKKLEMLATTDPLTKLQNRRGMLNHIEEYVTESREKSGMLLTLVIGDIDFFKHINDTYGHEAGDYVLETLAKIMNEFMEDKGMVARWGGEEFLFSLEGTNGDYAFEDISKLLHLIERYEFSFEGTPINVTMTFGVEEYDDYIGIDRVISKADEKLYMGKKQGRNRVIY